MPFTLRFTAQADNDLRALENGGDDVKLKKVRRTLARLESDPRHPGLQSHKYSSLHGRNGEDAWDSYVENHTPSAWRVFWHYGPRRQELTILTITPHP